MSDNRATDRGERAHPQGGGSSGGKTGGRDQRQQRDEQRDAEAATAKHTGYLAEQYGWTEAQVNVIRRAICVKATDEELEFFIATAKRLGLDPFARQIWFVKRRQKVEDSFGNESWVEVGRPETSIDGLRTIAERTGAYRGQAPYAWCGDDGAWRDVWLPKKASDGVRAAPAAARAIIFREGHRSADEHGGLVSVAHFDEFCPVYGFGANAKIPAMWRKMGANQIAKCAEAAGFRRAFPLEMSGIATDVEMEHTYAAADTAAATHAAPPKSSAPAALPAPDAELGASITELLERVRTASKRADLDQALEQVTALKSRAPSYAKRIDEAVKPLYDAKVVELRGKR